ncbi:hypothetical protein [Ralstonia insidiosa]|uniref:Uncharacterized protein n=1 Tax=Ralstonia insidiosa TaxID=190721 RepID=A0A848NUJ3_9RALS|nr:hypothetical protein [Ralstonia insidiosa]NMV36950.1 hypothetical protein [Ralstonia insidiosa]
MKTIEIKGWIFARPQQSWEGNGIQYEFSDFDYVKAAERTPNERWCAYRKLSEHTIRVDVPDDIDPVALMLQSLEAERSDLHRTYRMKLGEINERIGKLQALPFHGTEVVED